jgi:hypothetical protein
LFLGSIGMIRRNLLEKEESGPVEAYISQQERFSGEFCKKTKLWFYRVVRSISLKPFFFSFFVSLKIRFFRLFSVSQYPVFCEVGIYHG